jgi:putative transposase
LHCPKYRHPVLGVVKDDMRELFDETADHFGHDILALEIADDHVHLFVQWNLKHSPADIARQFKSYSGKHLLKRNSNIRESYFWGGGFWKVGYYVGTTGAVSDKIVERYIEETEHALE